MSISKVYLLFALGIVAGCTTQPAKNPSSSTLASNGPDVQCHTEELAGTMIGKTVCTTQADRDAQKRTDEAIRQQSMQGQSMSIIPPAPN